MKKNNCFSIILLAFLLISGCEKASFEAKTLTASDAGNKANEFLWISLKEKNREKASSMLATNEESKITSDELETLLRPINEAFDPNYVESVGYRILNESTFRIITQAEQKEVGFLIFAIDISVSDGNPIISMQRIQPEEANEEVSNGYSFLNGVIRKEI